jgi:hypothetical protein
MDLLLQIDQGQRWIVPGWFPNPLTAELVAEVIGSVRKVSRLPVADSDVGAETPVAGVSWFEVGVGTVREPDSQV